MLWGWGTREFRAQRLLHHCCRKGHPKFDYLRTSQLSLTVVTGCFRARPVTAELAFSQRVASALGLPDAMLLQGATAVGAKSSAMGGAPSWSECAESSNQQLLYTCRYINRHLELLLMEIYEEI